MSWAEVAIERQDNYQVSEVQQKLKQALLELNLLEAIAGKSVLIKHNCTGVFPPQRGLTTHPAVLEATTLVFKEAGGKITIGESSTFGVDTQRAFAETGTQEVARRLGIALIDFKKSFYVSCPVIGGLILENIMLPEEVLQTDYVVSLAKLKTNFVTGISGVMKNMKGVLLDTQKREFHRQGLSLAVVDLISLLKQHVNLIGVTDGILGSELFEPRAGGILVASSDLVACDTICSHIMGIDSGKIEHLQLGKIQQLGETDTDRISTQGDSLFSIDPPFKNSLPGLCYLAKEFEVDILDGKPCSTCIGGLYHALKKARSIKPELLKNMQIALGKWPGEDTSFDTIYFGNCAYRKSSSLNVIGCCPTSSDFLEILERYQHK